MVIIFLHMVMVFMVHDGDGDGGVGDLSGGDVDEILKGMVIVVVVMSMFLRFRMMNCNYWLCC